MTQRLKLRQLSPANRHYNSCHWPPSANYGAGRWGYGPKVLSGTVRFVLAADRRFRAQNTSPDNEARGASAAGRPVDRVWFDNEEGSDYEKGILAGGRSGSGAGAARVRWRHHQDRLCLDLQRPDRCDRQRHAQLVRAGARPSGPQDGRQAGRGDLRGRRPEARCRQAEDRKADPVRQGRFHRRLYLVERAAGLAEDRGRLQRPS